MTAAVANTSMLRPATTASRGAQASTPSEALAERAAYLFNSFNDTSSSQWSALSDILVRSGTQQTLSIYRTVHTANSSISSTQDALLSILVDSSSEMLSIGRDLEAFYTGETAQDAKNLTATLESTRRNDRIRVIKAAILSGLGIRPRPVRSLEQRLDAALRRIREAEAHSCP